jgi:signal transduction histidine kinase
MTLERLHDVKPGRKPPGFFWQALFILLPVTLMAGFGFWAILHQRRMVEQDAQERAAEILQNLPNDFGGAAWQAMSSDLRKVETAKSGCSFIREAREATWPGDPPRCGIGGATNESWVASSNPVLLNRAFPNGTNGLPSLTMIEMHLRSLTRTTEMPCLGMIIVDTNGLLQGQEPWPPTPPEWLETLTPAQRGAWTALEAADLAGRSATALSELASNFKAMAPPPDAALCADFLVLREQMRHVPASNAVRKLDYFALQNPVRAAGGISLASLALAEELDISRACGPSQFLWHSLQNEQARAGCLAPRLLDQAAQLVRGDPGLAKGVQTLQCELAEAQLWRELVGALTLNGWKPREGWTNLWVKASEENWLCVMRTFEADEYREVSNSYRWVKEMRSESPCYSERLLGQTFGNVLVQARISLPDYCGLACEFAGRPIPLSAPWNKTAGTPAGARVLAEARFQMPYPLCRANMETGPGPAFILRIILADRHLLYARQRQLQWIFGSLIALALVTAMAGFAAARRAFHRQLQLNEQKSNFVSSVSHELRAPIASVRLMAENLERGKIPEPARQAEYFRFIVQECRRLSSLIENVLDISRIEQGRKQYEPEPTDLAALVEGTVKLMEPYAAEKGVRLKWEPVNLQPSTSTLELIVDARAVQQALVNLIDNAIKHSPKGETVAVEIENDAGQATVRLCVADHGPGIPKAEQDKIFERFYRLGSELRRETPGVGIGLSIVKHVAEAHGGRAYVESEPGRGARFIIELPLNGQV